MKTIIQSMGFASALLLLGLGSNCLAAAESEGVAVAIIYDTSGSMKDPVRDAQGKSTPKFVIANRALRALARQIQTYATNSASGSPRRVEAGLYVFQSDGARAALPMGPFDAAALDQWAQKFSSPSGNTPLGRALQTAWEALLKSPLSHKHVLVITDGMNTAGPSPAEVLPQLKAQAAQHQAGNLGVHFVAFDVDAKVFESVKKLGATVVAAADEKQLDTQLDYILQRKILLEDEEPKKP